MPGIPALLPYQPPTAGELPRNTAEWTPDPARAVLLVHDMQRYFLGAFGGREPHDALVENAAALRDGYRARGARIAYTVQPGDMSDEDRGLLRDFWGPGMRSTPEDRQVVDALAPEPGDWVLTKWRYSAFFRSDLLHRMRAAGRDQLVLCGVYTHVGVVASAVEAFTHDIRTFVAADATADFSREHHMSALRYVAERCGMVLTTKELLR
ncbi:isochorismatase family protein [Streptomyces xiaopingdaonensis]|uniref:isochorismatase family protein n=1 Tax=Streptomyces xiaopingdaonensis TaxID=1565415 RepID=UPI000302BEF1|nr:isochorismatase family protein [Streptomyces xiaopingdaonensis]